MGKHVLSHPEKSLTWQALLQSMTLILKEAKTSETQVISDGSSICWFIARQHLAVLHNFQVDHYFEVIVCRL